MNRNGYTIRLTNGDEQTISCASCLAGECVCECFLTARDVCAKRGENAEVWRGDVLLSRHYRRQEPRLDTRGTGYASIMCGRAVAA